MDINLTKNLQQKMNARPRVRGRYNSSELFFINNGTTTPELWLTPKVRTVAEILTMWSGIGVHNQLEDLLGKENSEKKKEFNYKGITLVGKADYIPPAKGQVWEFKSSEKLMTTSKPWHDHQVKLYTTMFELPEGLIFQPVQNADGVYLRHLKTMRRDDAWFNQEMEKLYTFHQAVERLWQAKTNQ